MTNEQMNIAIAEHLGWKECRITHSGDLFHCFIGPSGSVGIPKNRIATFRNIPNYCNDLNAMHRAIETFRYLDVSYWYDYPQALVNICGSVGNAVNATAKQKAEAFLKTVGKL